VTFTLTATVETAAGCNYEVTKLTGMQTFGAQFADEAFGTAHIQRHVKCPKDVREVDPRQKA
jgi:hypothetical protein